MMQYVDFRLHLIPHSDALHVSVGPESGGGAVSQTSRLTVSAESLERLARALETERTRDFEPVVEASEREDVGKLLQELGRQLRASLFPTRVTGRWSAIYGRFVHPTRPIRLRLQMDLAGAGPFLHAVPWECLLSPEAGGPLALRRDLSLLRYVERPGADAPPPRPEKVVVLAVAPRCASQAPLAVDAELCELEEALRGSDVVVERLETPTLDALERRLQADEVHVVHFLGHGELDADRHEGVVYFEGAAGGSRRVTGSELANALEGCRSLRLLFLNACRTAAAATGSPFAGVATAAIQDAGLAAVIAMQYPIRDSACVRFAAEVYRHLAVEDDLDRAITSGRRQLHAAAPQVGAAAWMIPVVFSRLQGGALFDDGAASRDWTPAARPPAAVFLLGDGGSGSAVGLAAGLRRWSHAAGLAAAALLVGALYWTGSLSPGQLHVPADRQADVSAPNVSGSAAEEPGEPPTVGGGVEAADAPAQSRGVPPSTPAAISGDGPRDLAASSTAAEPTPGETQSGVDAGGETSRPPPGSSGSRENDAAGGAGARDGGGVRVLSEGRAEYFARQDAYVTAKFDHQGKVGFVTLDLVLAGEALPPKAVMGNETVQFDTRRGPLTLTVLGIDERRRELRILPPSSVAD